MESFALSPESSEKIFNKINNQSTFVHNSTYYIIFLVF